MTLTIDHTIPVEAAVERSDWLPVLTGVALQKHGKQHVLVATDSYICAIVPVKNAPGKDASTKDTIIPAATLIEHRKHLKSTRGRGIAKLRNGTATLRVDDEHVTIEHSDPSTGTTKHQRRVIAGTFPNAKKVVHDGDAEYGRIRVAVNAEMLTRLARAIGAERGRGRNRTAAVILDLPHATDGSICALDKIRVYPLAAQGDQPEACGVLMPIRIGDDRDPQPCV